MAILEMDQAYETPLTEIHRGPFKLRYAYARSKDCQESGEKGQDYLVWRVEPFRAAFALCDGVGQSFLGGIGAQVVGEALMEWLWMLPLKNESSIVDSKSLVKGLQNFLDSKKEQATKIIGNIDIKSVESELIRDALETRRKTRGTQSNFVCGIVDTPNQFYPKGRVLLFWLGDAKLQIWGKSTNHTPLLNANWNKQDGWSSLFGTSGKIHCFHNTLDDLDCVIAHSDGVDPIQQKISPELPLEELEKQFGQLGDDDVSYLELLISNPLANFEDDLVSEIRESPLLPVKIIQPPAKVIHIENKKPGISAWTKMIFALIVVSCSIIFGLVGYLVGSQNAPKPSPMIPNLPERLPSIGTPTISLPSATSIPLPTMTPLTTLTPITGPTNQVTISNLPPVIGGKLITGDKTLQLQINKCIDVVKGSSITVKPPFQLWAFETTGCQGPPVEFIQIANSVPLSDTIQSVKVTFVHPGP